MQPLSKWDDATSSGVAVGIYTHLQTIGVRDEDQKEGISRCDGDISATWICTWTWTKLWSWCEATNFSKNPKAAVFIAFILYLVIAAPSPAPSQYNSHL